ncbi:uncharacterized protein LOC122290941 [Carya illinoinensis]|uniref:uncharacterized protein LOC122290941 n=1 Tax=Carya illinoinensis TaxID=32201 RepID=UPI001C71EE3E|nr:uncharacterized protein LOC122290941 [Carya illinoinensis]
MGINANKLRPSLTPLKGFSGDTIQHVVATTLPLTFDTWTWTTTTMIDFLVVKSPSSYNAILGRPILNHLKVITSTYHLKMKFPIDNVVGELQGEQALARECDMQELRSGRNEALAPPFPLPLTVVLEKGVEVKDEQSH